MKLNDLKMALRDSKGKKIFIRVRLGPSAEEVSLILEKTPLQKSLDLAYSRDKKAETGLTFNTETGQLGPENDMAQPVSEDDDDEVLV